MKVKFLKKEMILVLLSLLCATMLVACSTHTPPTEEGGTDTNSSQETDQVSAKVQLYEGTYFDDRNFGDTILETFCEVAISNVTDTSFDFTVYQVEGETESKEMIFPTNTAVFTGDGTEAEFSGNGDTLHFTFPDYHSAYPVVTDMEISGFEPLEGKTYVNNGIPGHEFS